MCTHARVCVSYALVVSFVLGLHASPFRARQLQKNLLSGTLPSSLGSLSSLSYMCVAAVSACSFVVVVIVVVVVVFAAAVVVVVVVV
jgi:hypothetical protein